MKLMMKKMHRDSYPEKANTHTWKPGQSGNPAGRPKGKKNKFSKELRLHIQKILGKHMMNLDEDLTAMSPKDRVAASTAFMKYFLTTSKQIRKTVDTNVKINIKYKDTPQIETEDIIPIELTEQNNPE